VTEALASTKRQIVLTAERLFADHGLGASLRQIGFAAGNANKSAVHYHFGSKSELVQAIFEYRLGDLQARREELIEQYGIADLRSWLQCHIRAVLEQAENENSYYLRFLSQLALQPVDPPMVEIRAAHLGERVLAFHSRLPVLMSDIVEPLRSHRIVHAHNLMLHAGASRERARQANWALLPFEVAVTDLVETTCGFLDAPVSVRTPLRRLSAKSEQLPFLL
jgi:AcrR family transcriptional regulator